MPAAAESASIVYLTAAETAARIRSGALSAVEVARACLARIEALNPACNTVVDLHAEKALARAAKADAALARGEVWGALHGVPITIKDVFDVAGMRTTFGYPPLRRNVGKRDATAVARLRGAGAVVLGITNVPLGSYDWQCWNPLYGRTRNPWDARRTPGGSSGGSAAAIAAGFSALELGSDVAGSIRVPAHFCGVMGMKPTELRVSGRGHGNFPGSPYSMRHMAAFGPIARSVADLELAMELLAAPDPSFPDAPPVPFALRPAREPAALRVAWTDAFGGYPVSRETAAVLGEVAAKLAAAGVRVEKAGPEMDGHDALVAWGVINGFETGAAMPFYGRAPFRAIAVPRFGRGPWTRGLRQGLAMNARRYFHALDRRDAHSAAMDEFLAGCDAWLCPVAAVPAITHRRTGAAVEVDGRRVPYNQALGAWTSFLAMTGNPVVTLPAGRSADGLPIGIQVVGRRWDDAGVLAVAKAIESLTGGFSPPPSLAR
jgi:amidase